MPSRVVTISHTTGAGREAIGRTIADRLGFHYIDEEIITLAAEKEGVDAELVADTERRKGFLARFFSGLTEGPVDVGVPGPIALAPEAVTAPRSEDLRVVIIEPGAPPRGNPSLAALSRAMVLADHPIS